MNMNDSYDISDLLSESPENKSVLCYPLLLGNAPFQNAVQRARTDDSLLVLDMSPMLLPNCDSLAYYSHCRGTVK